MKTQPKTAKKSPALTPPVIRPDQRPTSTGKGVSKSYLAKAFGDKTRSGPRSKVAKPAHFDIWLSCDGKRVKGGLRVFGEESQETNARIRWLTFSGNSYRAALSECAEIIESLTVHQRTAQK
jgi:hypothetical protein